MSHHRAASDMSAPRLTTREFLDEIDKELSSLDRGMPWTLLQLLLRPGWAIRRYIKQRDPRLTKPFRFTLVCLAAAALLLHFSGIGPDFKAGFGASVGSGAASGSTSAMQRAGVDFFGHLDLLLVLCWLPAVAYALPRAYPKLELNFAEAFVFALYSLSLMVLLLTPIMLLPVDAALFVALTLLVPLWALTFSAWGYARPDGYGVVRALGFGLLAGLSCLLLLLGVNMLMTLGHHLIGG